MQLLFRLILICAGFLASGCESRSIDEVYNDSLIYINLKSDYDLRAIDEVAIKDGINRSLFPGKLISVLSLKAFKNANKPVRVCGKVGVELTTGNQKRSTVFFVYGDLTERGSKSTFNVINMQLSGGDLGDLQKICRSSY